MDKIFQKRDSEKLRGYLGNLYKDEDLFHNHADDGKSIYRMPLIQYKVIDGNLTITAYEKGVETVADKFLKISELIIDNNKYSNFETQFHVQNEEFFVDEILHKYIFESIWLPVNQKNYLSFINSKLDFNKILQNHILANFKGLGVTVDKKIMVNGDFKEKSVFINNIEHFGFTGNFVTNVLMPDFIGIGQKKSIGFGTVKKV